jgi:hypothetical protein
MCSDLVLVRFQDQTGRWVQETALVEDVSQTGLCISLGLPITVRREVEIEAEGFRGKAQVRYCELGEYSYLLGLEFSDGFNWDRQKWRPKHLLTLPEDNG